MLLDLMSFAGIALLSVPVLTLDWRKRQEARLGDPPPQATTPAAPQDGLAWLERRTRGRIARWVARWRAQDRACLYVGYGLLLTASFLRLFA
jgi:hypothetical protein